MYRRLALSLPAALILVFNPGIISAQQAENVDEEAKIENALSAAPVAIAEHAAVVDWDQAVLREGSNGWTCLPNPPTITGNAPMCLDGQWLKWAHAWVSRTEPEITGVGLAYMLAGGVDASNTDPYASEPAPGEDWVLSGPHVMIIVPDTKMLDALPTDPHSGGPWVMFKGTPYAHIMMPAASE